MRFHATQLILCLVIASGCTVASSLLPGGSGGSPPAEGGEAPAADGEASAAPDGEGSAAASTQGASQPPPEPVELAVGPAGGSGRTVLPRLTEQARCEYQSSYGPRTSRVDTSDEPIAVLDVSEPLEDVSVYLSWGALVRIEAVEGESRAGETENPAALQECISTDEAFDLPAGRYHLRVMDDGDNGGLPPGRGITVALRAFNAYRGLLGVPVPDGPLPQSQRAAVLWFPGTGEGFGWKNLQARFELLREAPRNLFLYAAVDLDEELASPQYYGLVTSDDEEPESVRYPRAGEPLLRVHPDYDIFLALDGSAYEVSSRGVATDPPGQVSVPGEPRVRWAPLSVLLNEAPDSMRDEVERFRQQREQANSCYRAAVTRHDNATDGITTARQRRAASKRFERDRRACGLAAVRQRRQKLNERLLEARAERFAEHLQQMRKRFDVEG